MLLSTVSVVEYSQCCFAGLVFCVGLLQQSVRVYERYREEQ